MNFLRGKKTHITSIIGMILAGLVLAGVADQSVLGGAEPGEVIQIAVTALFLRLGIGKAMT